MGDLDHWYHVLLWKTIIENSFTWIIHSCSINIFQNRWLRKKTCSIVERVKTLDALIWLFSKKSINVAPTTYTVSIAEPCSHHVETEGLRTLQLLTVQNSNTALMGPLLKNSGLVIRKGVRGSKIQNHIWQGAPSNGCTHEKWAPSYE